MKLPELKSKRKIRDAKICLMYLDGASEEEIGMQFGIHQSTVNRILYKHRTALKADIEHERTKRIHWLKRQIKLRGETKKDSADLMAQLQSELEPDKKQIVLGNTNIVIQRSGKKEVITATEEINAGHGRRIHING